MRHDRVCPVEEGKSVATRQAIQSLPMNDAADDLGVAGETDLFKVCSSRHRMHICGYALAFGVFELDRYYKDIAYGGKTSN